MPPDEVSVVVDPDAAGLAAAERALTAGEAVVLPTDTVYGLGARPDVTGATARLFEIKGRPRALTLPVLVAATADAEAIARFDDRARALAQRFWPGGLTLVLPRLPRSEGWDLGAERATVGVRVPASDAAAALLSQTGPLAVTSANPSGEPTPRTCEEVRAALGDRVAVYLCAGPSASDAPSTVVELVADARVLREGTISAEDVLAALR